MQRTSTSKRPHLTYRQPLLRCVWHSRHILQGMRCQHAGCSKSARGGGTLHCVSHGGGRWCQLRHEGCLQIRPRRYTALYRARRRQAVPALGLPQVGSNRRHTELQGAWRRQAVPARGLHQVRSRRYGALRLAWRGQALPARGLPHCILHGGGKRCKQEGCSKPVAPGPGSVYCKQCLQSEQPDDA
jgi:hypothetical protein